MNDCKYKPLRTKYKIKLTLITIGDRNKLNMLSFIKMIIFNFYPDQKNSKTKTYKDENNILHIIIFII